MYVFNGKSDFYSGKWDHFWGEFQGCHYICLRSSECFIEAVGGTVWMFFKYSRLKGLASHSFQHLMIYPWTSSEFCHLPKAFVPMVSSVVLMALMNWWTAVSVLQTWFLATAFWCMGIGASSMGREVEIGWMRYWLHPTDGKEICCCCGSVWHCTCVDMERERER